MSATPSRAITPRNGYTHAVVMGDLIRSEDAPSVNRLHTAFNEVIDEVNASASGIVSALTITLGDEFQGLCRSLTEGLKAIRAVRLGLLTQGVECRFAVGVAQLETPVRSDRAWNLMGPGLSATRDKVSDKRSPNAYRFYLPEEPLLQQLLEAVGYSLTVVERDWTDRQREIATASLADNKPARELAQELGLSPRTVYKIRNAARLDLYETQWRALESATQDLDIRYGLSDA